MTGLQTAENSPGVAASHGLVFPSLFYYQQRWGGYNSNKKEREKDHVRSNLGVAPGKKSGR